MIFWSGRGILSILILGIMMVASKAILPDKFFEYACILSYFVSATFSWHFGQKWNNNNERIVIDEKTGKLQILKTNHSLYWIPMQYWGIIFGIIGVIESFVSSLILGASVLVLTFAFSVYLYMNRSTKKNNAGSVRNENTSRQTQKTMEEFTSEAKQAAMNAEAEKIKKEKENPDRYMPK